MPYANAEEALAASATAPGARATARRRDRRRRAGTAARRAGLRRLERGRRPRAREANYSVMTSSLPPDVCEVFESFVTTEYATVDAASSRSPGPSPLLPPREGRRSTSRRGSATRRRPTTRCQPPRRAAVLRPDGLGLDDPPHGARAGHRHGGRPRPRRQPRALPARVGREAAGDRRTMHPPRLMRGMFDWYYDAPLRQGASRARLRVARRGPVERSPSCSTRASRRCAPGHSEEPEEGHAPPEGGATGGTSAWRSSARRYATAVLSWVGPDGFPLRLRVPVAPRPRRGPDRPRGEPEGLPRAEGRACLTAHAHAPDFTWQGNFQVRGDLVRDGDGWALVPHRLIGGFELPDESRLGVARRNFSKSMRFARTARKRLKQRR